MIVIEESQLPHEHLIVLAIYLTVGLSVFAHGLTAAPLANRYADWFERHPRDKAPPMESAPTEVTRRAAVDAREHFGSLASGCQRLRTSWRSTGRPSG